jgi:hypothetical protein
MRPEIEKKIDDNLNPRKVSLSGLNICDNEVLEIMEAIKIFKHTATTIDLDNNNISDEGVIILSQKLRDFEDIKEISLQYNKIGKRGAIELFSLKKYFSELDILFHGNKITNTSEMEDIEEVACSKSTRF